MRSNTDIPRSPLLLSLDDPRRPENNGVRLQPIFEEDKDFSLPSASNNVSVAGEDPMVEPGCLLSKL